MYAKTNPAAGHLTKRQKRVFAIAAAAIVLVFAGLGLWGALAHDGYSSSGHGCVSVTVASSTGGATLHYCGAQARSFCQAEYRQDDELARASRPQCVLAGLEPTASASP